MYNHLFVDISESKLELSLEEILKIREKHSVNHFRLVTGNHFIYLEEKCNIYILSLEKNI